MTETLAIWVIYNSPIDLPGRFVARKWLLNQPTPELLQAQTLEEIRSKLPLGLVRMPRDERDDPKIVESWF
ncbi:hypothetical protein [Undibacterium oligocarboniphilum]|uniref:Uncharacterized protein n=1 Tax=Undibacterium oligocarboniphilum TaxID=666702 RepID=A0A850QII7_9BURK|nr:hypothetical protein [Undibacterium oligocarboniphilum]MBC3871517.1 hypothetical protein [Undibacterium oligocarboniphilum]NVO78907.1 hypothetical protein [Undibacterium oligocarboniphilum]